MVKRVTISLPEEMVEEIDDQLTYGDSRSQWIEDAIQQKLREETEGNPNRALMAD